MLPRALAPLLKQKPFQGALHSPQDFCQLLWECLRYHTGCLVMSYRCHYRFRDQNLTLFRWAWGNIGLRPTLPNRVRPPLRTDRARSNCCWHRTLLLFSSHLNSHIYHQDLLHLGSHTRLLCSVTMLLMYHQYSLCYWLCFDNWDYYTVQ